MASSRWRANYQLAIHHNIMERIGMRESQSSMSNDSASSVFPAWMATLLVVHRGYPNMYDYGFHRHDSSSHFTVEITALLSFVPGD
ncbi:hypothetical protein KIN20_032489 [Parelaphostrongylus tenuis]|uniref:Uncharacterized protein n=1 Tax=Parelaphostrongylus tenuis TaxID=148309 RepID=A0AAD5WHJ2_PARTN|nr:hypothetical protein KIN20_032489 [Parelaphostrongylus tenuis]